MSWGIDFTADIFLSRISIANEYELEDLILQTKQSIEDCRKSMLMFASANPKDIIPEDWKEEPMRFIQLQLKDVFDQYEEHLDMMFKLELYKEYLQENK